jgi:hypothetical protein
VSADLQLPALASLGGLKDAKPVIIVDTREQNPLVFSRLETRPGILYSGDYSIAGFGEQLCDRKKVSPRSRGVLHGRESATVRARTASVAWVQVQTAFDCRDRSSRSSRAWRSRGSVLPPSLVRLLHSRSAMIFRPCSALRRNSQSAKSSAGHSTSPANALRPSMVCGAAQAIELSRVPHLFP